MTGSVTRASPEAAAGPLRSPWWRRRWRWPYSFAGTAFGVLFFCLSLTPSLLPRSWVVQGLMSGIATAMGYGIGVFSSHVARMVLPREPSPGAKRVAWRILGAGGLTASLVFLSLHSGWQEEIHVRMGVQDPVQVSHLGTIALAAVVVAVLVAVGRGFRLAARLAGRLLRRWVPEPVAAVVGTGLVAVLVVGVLDGVVLEAGFRAADRTFQVVNETTNDGASQPRSALRSGGPGTLAPWETLGVQGRDFVAAGPGQGELSAFHGRPALEPIRVYTGLDSAEDSRSRAALAVSELERTGAFDRRVLGVMGTTGTGWVNPMAVAALEYLHNGDTAVVATQHSYLPSWISFLVDQNRAAEAFQELFDEVYERLEALPAGGRPLLLIGGESLGSFAAESAFSGLPDLRNRVDGAVFVGPPHFNPLWGDFVSRRDPGSPQRLPVLDAGETVRFASRPGDLWAPGEAWPAPRVVYLQHASDPVVWWSTRLLLRRPPWLAEPRGPEVLPAVRWYPFVTFWQVTADMFHATRVPAGYGHLYGTLVADAWAAVAPPAGWTPQDTARLRRILDGGEK